MSDPHPPPAESDTAFPKLSKEQIECAAAGASLRSFDPGETLFEIGDKDLSLFIVIEGEVEIVERSTGEARQVTVHQPGEFTGDVDVLTGRPAVVEARALNEVRTLEVSSRNVRRLLLDVPELSEMLLEAFQARRRSLEASGFLGLRVVGQTHCPDTLQIREVLYKNKVPHTYRDSADEEGQKILKRHDATVDDTPLIETSVRVLKSPSVTEVAGFVGIRNEVPDRLYDVVVVGAGPAGLGAAVYAGSEGLATLVVDRIGPGGQAGTSSLIENYMGFPAGLSGADLANRGYLQAMKFGVDFLAPVTVETMSHGPDCGHRLELSSGQTVRSKTVLIATGASYRELPVEGGSRLLGSGIYYSATSVEARLCRDGQIVIVGGGNSAGQAAMYLSETSCDVKLILRGDDLRKGMSAYLADRIEKSSKIDVLYNSEISAIDGDQEVESITITGPDDSSSRIECAGLFVFIGASPHTSWLPDTVACDEDGFVRTGPAVRDHAQWTLDEDPDVLETSCPGVFAAGDVRSGSTKRVAFAVGDGAMAVTCLHRALARLP